VEADLTAALSSWWHTSRATAFAEFDEGWLGSGSAADAQLAVVGADRLILDMTPPYDLRRIADAGHLLDR